MDDNMQNFLSNLCVQGEDLKYMQSPICFKDCTDHYELIYTGEFESVGKDSVAVMQVMQDLMNGDKDIELHILINSVGGDVENLSMVLQQVLQYHHRVTVCCGAAMSAGFLLWACGHEKYVSPYGELMYHTVYSGYEGKGIELSAYGKHIENLTQKLIEAVDIPSLISKEDLERGKNTEVWYTGEQFIQSGKAFDYSEYCTRKAPTLAIFTVAGDNMFAKSGNNYVKLEIDFTKEYTYQEIVEIARNSTSTIQIGLPLEDESTSKTDVDVIKKKKSKKGRKNDKAK